MIRLYICASSMEMPRVRSFAAAVEAHSDVEITHRWWDVMTAAGVADDDMPLGLQREHALSDLEGLRQASIVVVLVPGLSATSRGLPVELGAALEGGKTIVISGASDGPKWQSLGIFAALADHRLDSDGEALAWLRGFAAREAAR